MKMAAKRGLVRVSKAVWRVPLDHATTVQMLAGHEIQVADDGVLHLPNREPVSGEVPSPFAQRDVQLEPEYVWLLEAGDGIRSVEIGSSGGILLNRKYLLDTDFGSVQGIADPPFRRRRLDLDVAIAPWSHNWATYYEFVVHILAKLCRIKESVDPSIWQAAKVCYPLRKSSFERQYLSLLGLDDGDLIDTREYRVEPRSTVLSNVQGGDRLVPRTRLTALREAFLGASGPLVDGGRRLYLSREGFKRQVLNEPEVIDVVTSHGVEIIESIPESVEEQIRLFSSASLVISAHGSGLTNLVWCAPGTRVIELFSRSFVSDVYSSICQILGFRHTYLVDDAKEPHHWTNLHKDLTVDIKSLVTALEAPAP
jgi:capsular polysaccharide biosynthesis protein